MEDSELYMKVRKKLLAGETLVKAKYDLLGEGYSQKDIDYALMDFFRDERTFEDNKLIDKIEEKISSKEYERSYFLQDIFADLIKEGNKPYEIEKALLRANISRCKRIRDAPEVFRRWNIYTTLLWTVFAATVLLAFYKAVFLICSVAWIIIFAINYFYRPKLNQEWKTEIGVIPFMGLRVTDGEWGFNSAFGTYFRWWIIDPSIVMVCFLILFGLFFSIVYGASFAVLCIALAIVDFLAYIYRPMSWNNRVEEILD
jgi:hypothetical protein